ncbi:MAG: pirin family protein [Actinomycetota bacterium]|nr:pirin family protein [Actinomycetota bacterium]MDK1016921.1 pirin family protein [Actinomycetota bacterium]MDK1026649.1 pirin family protein [Actinomycetota bacterium]MDK1037494.1 pirin family protein [Actinomycetota bacterium]MDK1095927.1 pirin family protein [Actinomycetota bacterium]
MTPAPRTPTAIIPSIRALEGAGFAVRRPFPTGSVDHYGPFLLLDEIGPTENEPGEAKGAPDHPHRGFETVTYLLDGEIEHADSVGNRGVIRPGEVQWMTAGAGIVHSEMPTDKILRNGGRVHGFQLWVNLPKAAKMHRPRYQDLTKDRIPVVDIDGGQAVVIAGEAYDTKGAAETFLPVTYVHVSLEAGATTELDAPGDQVAFLYIFGGDATILPSQQAAIEGDSVFFDAEPGPLSFEAGPDGVDMLVGIAEPLNEPVVRYGPFVMNTKAEIYKAFDDYNAGLMGSIEPELA